MTRRVTAAIAAAFLLALAVFDAATSELDPFRAPPALALGSGLASGGAHCSALPR
ncbi:MAG: hypothetical protein V2I65_11905 [Paracoccaceae bacterium]|jgi:hypothetical protein|nr:hypothetical protein [Paracoccaceae bacterium]